MSDGTDVLIVGGSLVGLSTALFLRLHGVDCLAVERHTGTAIHPRAGHFQLRTVEILRSAGLEERSGASRRRQYLLNGGINNVESLAGREIASYFPNLNAGVEEFSPTLRLFIDQDVLEPILRARARELGRGAAQPSRVHRARAGRAASPRRCGISRTAASGRCARTTSSPPTATAAPPASDWGSPCAGHGVLSNSITIYFRRSRPGPTARGPRPGRQLRHQPRAARVLPARPHAATGGSWSSTWSATPRGPRSSPRIRRRRGRTWPRRSTSSARWSSCAPRSASPRSRL